MLCQFILYAFRLLGQRLRFQTMAFGSCLTAEIGIFGLNGLVGSGSIGIFAHGFKDVGAFGQEIGSQHRIAVGLRYGTLECLRRIGQTVEVGQTVAP